MTGETNSTYSGAWRAWRPGSSAAVLLPIVIFALFLRTYRLEPMAWIPDTYEQLDASRHLVHGELPLSHLYPPGVALTVAPAFVFLPATLASLQTVIIAASLALVVVCYAGAKKTTGDNSVATFLAAGVAAAPMFVYFSRDGLFDVINALWITSAIILARGLRGRSVAAFAAYGVLLSVAANVRETNVAFLPALLILWSDAGRSGSSLRRMVATVWCREIAVTAAVLLILSGLIAYVGGWVSGGRAASVPLPAPGQFGRHIALYGFAEFGNQASLLIAPLAFVGARELWRRDRALLFASLYMLGAWPLAHSLVRFSDQRYMLPSYVFALLLAAHAPSAIWRKTANSLHRTKARARLAVVCAVLLTALVFGAADTMILYRWPAMAADSDEGAMREMRPAVAALPSGSLLVSAAARGVRESNPHIEYLDLIDYSRTRGNDPDSVDAVLVEITGAEEDGRRVYYLHSRIDTKDDLVGPGGYEVYFRGITRSLGITLVFAASASYNTLFEVNHPRAEPPGTVRPRR